MDTFEHEHFSAGNLENSDAEESSEILPEENELHTIESESGLSPEELEKARVEFHLDEQLRINESAIAELQHATYKKMKLLVDALAEEGVSSDEQQTLMMEHGVNLDPIGRGAFYDAFAIEGTDDVLKLLKLNYLFNQEQAVRMLARHAYEAERFKEFFKPELLPETIFICPSEWTRVFDEETQNLQKGNVLLYDLATFIKIQTDRRLQAGYAYRDVPAERAGIDKVMGKLGEVLHDNGIFRDELAGAMLERRVQGITFKELMDRGPQAGGASNWDVLRTNVQSFVESLTAFNQEYAFLWHRLDSDNVLLETDDQGELTGGIKIIDRNFTEKSFECVRRLSVDKADKEIIGPIREYFNIG